MKIGIMFPEVGVAPGHERNVSAHVQIPLKTAELLTGNGHEVHLITTQSDFLPTLPAFMPTNCSMHILPDGRMRHIPGIEAPTSGYRPLELLRQLMQLRALTKIHELDFLHLFGFERMMRLAGLLNFILPSTPVVATVFGQRPNPRFRQLYRRIDRIASATSYMQEAWATIGNQVTHTPHGILRDFETELTEEAIHPSARNRVLFWREASHRGGGDLCVKAFNKLAPKFPHFEFTFAVRRTAAEVPGLEDLEREHTNVRIFRFPYPEGISLARLLAESICVVLPFRSVTINPQLAVAESLSTGTAVVTTDVNSLPELVRDGITGAIVPSDDAESLSTAIAKLLSDPTQTAAMGARAKQEFAANWNWKVYLERLEQMYKSLQ